MIRLQAAVTFFYSLYEDDPKMENVLLLSYFHILQSVVLLLVRRDQKFHLRVKMKITEKVTFLTQKIVEVANRL